MFAGAVLTENQEKTRATNDGFMLDIVGQEEVLRETLTQYGYSDDEVREYLSGPGYYAWF